ncbi:MAG: prenyltransferase/squalene oxidase repeat-containing protein [Verrucomicrobiota bacterium]|nr:prenyltransferase/squalene oxidase repeat-containing protein [Verrucomicrobiota bacterium]
MSLRLEMLQVARVAPTVLGEAAGLVKEFLRGQQNPDGGFKDRSGKSDLYYTVFGMDALAVFQAEPNLDAVKKFLGTFADGDGLDLVHLSCLTSCWGSLGKDRLPKGLRVKLLQRLESFRKPCGGWDNNLKREHGTAYGSFLALGAYQDMGKLPPKPLRILQSLKKLETPDHAWNNHPNLPIGSTNPTAGAVVLLNNLHLPINAEVGQWLRARLHPQGGFVAVPGAPMPDLLSTATALHALAAMDVRLTEEETDRCLDFVDSLWNATGGFHGHWSDDYLDCEYTFYGLLALGHLSLNG